MTEKEIELTNLNFRLNIIDGTKGRLNSFANTRDYDDIISLCTYATSTNLQYKAEGEYGVTARDSTWDKVYEILADVDAGRRPMPTSFEQIIPELPVLEWPTT